MIASSPQPRGRFPESRGAPGEVTAVTATSTLIVAPTRRTLARPRWLRRRRQTLDAEAGGGYPERVPHG